MSSVDLFRIVVGSEVWRFTSSSEPQEHESEEYVPTPIGRGEIQTKSDLARSDIELRLPLEHPLSVELLSSWNESIITLTVFTKRPSGTEVSWKGRFTNTQPDNAHLKLIFESIYTSMRRPGLRARFQKSCRHALYGRGCDLDPESFAQAATLSAITGSVLTVPEASSFAAGYFSGGMVRAPDGVLTYITNHSGSSLTVNRVSRSLAEAFATSGPGLAITIYPGCDHSYATCEAKFLNGLNYGGFDYIPSKNPMGGTSIV